MKTFHTAEFQMCAALLSDARTPFEVELAWSSLGNKHPNLSAILSLENYPKSALPPTIDKYSDGPKSYLTSYFQSSRLFFFDDDMASQMHSNGEIHFGIDYTLMFDTNVATYINKLVRNEPLGKIEPKVRSLLDSVLRDNLNFDHIFYMMENSRSVPLHHDSNPMSKLAFWKRINKKFRSNMVSLQLFRSINSEQYAITGDVTPEFSYFTATRNAILFCHDFYASKAGQEHVTHFVLIQRLILLSLIGMVNIQLSSKKGAAFKISKYFKYVHEIVGVYMDREAIIAHTYFSDSKNIKMLEKIKKGASIQRLIRQLSNIAWDMAAPRMMEKMMTLGGAHHEEARYFIPMFMSFDAGLKELLSIYRVKGAIYDRINGDLVQLPEKNSKEYFLENGCGQSLDALLNPISISERRSRARPDRQSVHSAIRQEFKTLRNLLKPEDLRDPK
jgi:hypothetical protein